ncbi:MAG TPA: radical SAM protein, partial [bacterium]|nr:radical SAM protein [bacterium]
GLSYLTTLLNKNGHTAKIYDMELAPEGDNNSSILFRFKASSGILEKINDFNSTIYSELENVLQTFNPDIAGISIMTNKMNSAINIAKYIKRFNDRIILCAGGVHPTICQEDFINENEFDYIFNGEAENSFLEFIKDFENGKSDKRIYIEKKSVDMDIIDFPRRDCIINKNPSVDYYSSILMSRGCPYSCKYCNSNVIWRDKKVRFRKIENVIKELSYLKTNFNVTNFYMWDDNLFIDKKYIFRFCNEMIEKKLNMTWSCQMRLNLIDKEIIDLIKKSGCSEIKVGIESGSEEIQKSINKKIDYDRIFDKINIVKENGLCIGNYFIIGFPDETENDMEKTYELMKNIDPDSAELNLFNLLPRTGYYDEFDKLKIQNWSMHSQENLNNYIFSKLPKEIYIKLALRYAALFDEHNEKKQSIISKKKYKLIKDNGFIASPVMLYNYASALESEKQYSESIDMFKKILNLNYNISGANYHLGSIFMKKSDFENAREHFIKCIKNNPAHIKAKEMLKIIENK